jgi:hypothetical protein
VMKPIFVLTHPEDATPGSLLSARHMSRGRLSRRPRGYDVDASVMSFQLHERGIHALREAAPGRRVPGGV